MKISEEFNLEGVPIRITLRDEAYKNRKENIRNKTGKNNSLKNILLKQRKLSNIAKKKILKMNIKNEKC